MANIKYCNLCERNVVPSKKLNWFLTIITAGWYLLYYFAIQKPECPICGNKGLMHPHAGNKKS